MEKSEEEVINLLRSKVALLLREWNRPEHLFSLDADRAVLLVIDMQNFVGSPRVGPAFPSSGEVIRNINTLVDHCHGMMIPVIWIRQNFTVRESEAGFYPLFHRGPFSGEVYNSSQGTEICEDLHYNPALDHQVTKNGYSAFSRGASNLEDTLMPIPGELPGHQYNAGGPMEAHNQECGARRLEVS